jgi:subtilisin family serine protease
MRVAVLDTGVHPKHPHVPRILKGYNAIASGVPEDWYDRMGHGTAVAGAIVSHAPEAEILAVKIFERGLRTNLDTILRGVEWALGEGAEVLNLSLGTTNPAHAEALSGFVARGGLWVSAAYNEGIASLPGLLAGVVSVEADASLDRADWRELGVRRYAASPYPREIPGVPREKNLNGISFAVANVSGLIAGGKIVIASAE